MKYIITLIILINPLLVMSYETIKKPLIIGHRGASGYLPEHTLASYELAIKMGADYIEPDLVMTKDRILIARHENEISETTDVALKFPDRKTTKIIDGQKITGWFTEDFTLKEIKTLKAKERLVFRNQTYNGQFEIPTLKEILIFLKNQNALLKKNVGIYPETKHPTYFKSIGLPLEKALVEELKSAGMNEKNSKVFIQSFELTNLLELKTMTSLPLVFLIGDLRDIPYDLASQNDKRTYGDLIKLASLKELKKTISGIGPHKRILIPEDSNKRLTKPTDLVKNAHTVGLVVHPYTFRNESQFLHPDYKNRTEKEYLDFFKLDVDGVFTDFPDTAVKALENFN